MYDLQSLFDHACGAVLARPEATTMPSAPWPQVVTSMILRVEL